MRVTYDIWEEGDIRAQPLEYNNVRTTMGIVILSYVSIILTSSASKKNVTLCRSRLNQLIEIIDRSASCSFTLLYESSIDRVET